MGTGRQPRVLYLSFYFPPSRASGVYRARATANYLAKHGWDVTVLAAPMWFLQEAGAPDEELAATVDERIRVERPALHRYQWTHDLRSFSRFRANLPVLAQRGFRWSLEHLFPESYGTWGIAALARALRRHARQRFDLVLATGNPFASFATAWLFHRLTGVPYVVDYRDSWTLNLFTDSPAFPKSHPAWWWERRIIRDAGATVFVNEALRGWHAERYPAAADRMMVVPNGWDPDLLHIDVSADPASADRGRPLSFGYLGTVTRNQPVAEMIEAFRRARSHPDLRGAELNIHGHLGFFRSSPHALLEMLASGPAPDGSDPAAEAGLRLRGPVSKTDVASVYEHTDVLVFLAAGARYVTSGKIFEYMASARPIVSVHAPGIAAGEVLAGYPLWFNADSLDVDEVADSMVSAGKAARDLTAEQRVQACRHAEGYTRDLLMAPLEERMRSLLRRRAVRG